MFSILNLFYHFIFGGKKSIMARSISEVTSPCGTIYFMILVLLMAGHPC